MSVHLEYSATRRKVLRQVLAVGVGLPLLGAVVAKGTRRESHDLLDLLDSDAHVLGFASTGVDRSFPEGPDGYGELHQALGFGVQWARGTSLVDRISGHAQLGVATDEIAVFFG